MQNLRLKSERAGPPGSNARSGMSRPVTWVLTAGVVLIIGIIWVGIRSRKPDSMPPDSPRTAVTDTFGRKTPRQFTGDPRWGRRHPPAQVAPEQIVAGKLSQYARLRRDLGRRMAEKLGVEFTPEMERFFDAIEAGDWEETQSLAGVLLGVGKTSESPESPPNHPLRPVLMEAWGVAEVAHQWPAQALLDYGARILETLEPGTIYLGGTDPGRFIPTLLNETTDGDRHIVLTQNALADHQYLEYLACLYPDQLAGLTVEDSQRAFNDYLSDARRRWQHDQQFPDEPKQVGANEGIQATAGGGMAISGSVAVMQINGLLLETLMAKNPAAGFMLEESLPIPSTYRGGAVAGPLIRLQAVEGGGPMPAETAQQALRYWLDTGAQVMADAAWFESTDLRNAYAKLAEGQANLLAHQNFNREADQLYQMAHQLSPTALPPVERYAEFLRQQGRQGEALQVLDTYARANPDQQAETLKVRQRLAEAAPASP